MSLHLCPDILAQTFLIESRFGAVEVLHLHPFRLVNRYRSLLTQCRYVHLSCLLSLHGNGEQRHHSVYRPEHGNYHYEQRLETRCNEQWRCNYGLILKGKKNKLRLHGIWLCRRGFFIQSYFLRKVSVGSHSSTTQQVGIISFFSFPYCDVRCKLSR